MDGVIYLDESYDSGVPGCPGSRFVMDFKQAPADSHRERHTGGDDVASSAHSSQVEDLVSPTFQLPEFFSVLFVDDDPILRKLFARSIKRVCPGWSIREASNGETALCLVEANHFDLIFMDMYMASVTKQLLGTETVAELRSRGVDCRICGLSANDKETDFMEAGADAFTFKPFPCAKNALKEELRRILFSKW
jgi:CheY-like chemotaxis protein